MESLFSAGFFIKRGDLIYTYTQGHHHVKMQAVIEVMHLQAEESQRLPTNHQKLGGRKGSLSLIAIRGTNPEDTLMS